jgi:Zn finger protein HypA/HybF involved in hydrogenase expression
LSKDLARYFGSHVQFNHIWTNQKFTLNKDALGYLPKKGKEAFIPKESIFVNANVSFEEEEKIKMCHKCKTRVDVDHQCKSKKTVSLDPSYIFKKDSKGVVCAKCVGRSLSSSKKKSIWVPKILVTNIEGPKKIWVPKTK